VPGPSPAHRSALVLLALLFSLAVDGLGDETGRGSGVLIMAIVGGALIPVGMGALADAFDYRVALSSTVLAYAYIAWFAWRGAEPSASSPDHVGG